MKRKEYIPNKHNRRYPEVGDRFTYLNLDDLTQHDAIAIERREVARRWGCDAIHADGFIRYVWDGQVTLVHERVSNE